MEEIFENGVLVSPLFFWHYYKSIRAVGMNLSWLMPVQIWSKIKYWQLSLNKTRKWLKTSLLPSMTINYKLILGTSENQIQLPRCNVWSSRETVARETYRRPSRSQCTNRKTFFYIVVAYWSYTYRNLESITKHAATIIALRWLLKCCQVIITSFIWNTKRMQRY